jgi:hypothetical protein
LKVGFNYNFIDGYGTRTGWTFDETWGSDSHEAYVYVYNDNDYEMVVELKAETPSK